MARLFDGWEAARLAGVLGLPEAEVQRLPYGGVLAVNSAGYAQPSVGDLGVTTQALWLRPWRGGGFTARLSAYQGAAEVPVGSGAEVLAVQGGKVLLRLLQAGGADKLAWVRLEDYGQLCEGSIQA